MNEAVTRIQQVKIISKNKNTIEYGWYKTSDDAILNLGSMKKAVIIRKVLSSSKYFISYGSFFPFGEKIYSNRYDSVEEAIKEVNVVILKWLSETYNFLNIN